MKDNMSAKNTAILAIDALQVDAEQIAMIVNGMKRFYGENIPAIQPVYVLNPDSAPLPLAWFDEVAEKLKREATERFRKWTQGVPFQCQELVVLVEHETSHAVVVERLNQYAKQSGASLAIVATSSKTGFNRMILGSFAEAMVLNAKLPLLTISPEETTFTPTKKRSCMCPIDFLHDDASVVMNPILAMAQKNDFEIVLFTATPALGPAGHWAQTLVLKELQRQLQREADEMEAKAQKFVEQAKQLGITARILREEAPSGIPEAIADVAKRDQVAFIAMASKSKKGGMIFTGSITRKLVRITPCPIWIIPPAAQQ